MSVDLATEIRQRYGTVGTDETLLVQLTNDDVNASTVNTTKLGKAINDAQAIFERYTGREFEFAGISASLLNWQTAQVCQLTVFVLEAYKNRAIDLEAYGPINNWITRIQNERERNDGAINPTSNSPITATRPNPPQGNVYPAFNDDEVSDFVPNSRGSAPNRYNGPMS